MSQSAAEREKVTSSIAAPQNTPAWTVIFYSFHTSTTFPASSRESLIAESHTILKNRLNQALTNLSCPSSDQIYIAHLQESFETIGSNPLILNGKKDNRLIYPYINESEVQCITSKSQQSKSIESKSTETKFESIKSLIDTLNKKNKDSQPRIIIAAIHSYLHLEKYDEKLTALKKECSKNTIIERCSTVDDILNIVEKKYRPLKKERAARKTVTDSISSAETILVDSQNKNASSKNKNTSSKINNAELNPAFLEHARSNKETIFNYIKNLAADAKSDPTKREETLGHIDQILQEGTPLNKMFRVHRNFVGIRKLFGFSLFKPASDQSGLLKEIHKLKIELEQQPEQKYSS